MDSVSFSGELFASFSDIAFLADFPGKLQYEKTINEVFSNEKLVFFAAKNKRLAFVVECPLITQCNHRAMGL